MKYRAVILGLLLLAVAPRAFTQDVTPTILVQPASQTNVLGDAFEFDISTDDDNAYDFQWRKNNVAISGEIDTAYLVGSSTISDAGIYDCVVTNPGTGLSVTSAPAVLTIWYPAVITQQPTNIVNVLGDAFEFDISTDDDNAYDFQWRKNNVAISGEIDTTYLVESSTISDAGIYDCVVTNPGTGLSVTSAPAVLTIWYPPVITRQPTNIVAILGDDVTFTVQVAPLIPTNFTYQWLNEGVAMFDGTEGYGSTNYGTATASLTISNVQPADAGDYSVDVNNDILPVLGEDSDALSTNVTLTVIVPPIITDQPDSDTNAYQGDYVLFSVSVDPSTTDDPDDGYPLTYQWYKNGSKIAGATDWNYELDSVDTPNDGNYCVVIKNYGGSVTSAVATLTVYDPPVITVQPADKLVATNTTVNLRVTATGTALNYQWYNGSNLIDGATNATYSFLATSTNQSGTFSVYVYNVVDSVFSAAAVVEIRPSISTPVFGIVNPGEGSRITNSTTVTLSGQVNISLAGAAAGSVLTSVLVQNNGGPASNSVITYGGKTTAAYWFWHNTQSLIPGTNTFLLTPGDNYGNQGSTYTRHVFCVVPSPLTLLVSGPGTVSSNWSGGNLLEIGRSYSLTATPSNSFKFLNWSGGVSSTNPVLNFLMQSNLVIQANFVTTNPPAPAINLKLTNSQAWISFTSSIGATYTLQYKNALTDPAWGSLPGLFSGTGNLLTLTDRLSSPPTRLYRLQAVGTNGVTATPPIIGLNLTNGQARISFTSQTNVAYTLSFKNTFGDSSWGALPGPTNGNGGTITLIDSTLPAATRFYRLQSTTP